MVIEVTTSAVSLFPCDRRLQRVIGTQKGYLVQDYSIECGSAEHQMFMALGAGALFFWCLLVPLFLLWKLYSKRAQLNPDVPRWPLTASQAVVHNEERLAVLANVDVQPYLNAACAAAKVQILALGKEHGLPKELAQEVQKPDGTWGVMWCGEPGSGVNEKFEAAQRISKQVKVTAHKYQERTLKAGLRVIQEMKDGELARYSVLYSNCIPSRWWFELVSIVGRFGFSLLIMLPGAVQCMVGATLSGALAVLTASALPYLRMSDNYLQILSYASVMTFFVLRDGMEASRLLEATNIGALQEEDLYQLQSAGSAPAVCLCIAIPILGLLYYVIKAYFLESRHLIWAKEKAFLAFASEAPTAGDRASSNQEANAMSSTDDSMNARALRRELMVMTALREEGHKPEVTTSSEGEREGDSPSSPHR